MAQFFFYVALSALSAKFRQGSGVGSGSRVPGLTSSLGRGLGHFGLVDGTEK